MTMPEALDLVLASAEFGRHISAELASRSLPMGNIPVSMLASLERDGPQRPSDLAAVTGLTSGRISQLIGEMEAGGLVVRTPSPDDGRSTIVQLTEVGRTAVADVTEVIVAAVRNSPDSVRRLRDSLDIFLPTDQVS